MIYMIRVVDMVALLYFYVFLHDDLYYGGNFISTVCIYLSLIEIFYKNKIMKNLKGLDGKADYGVSQEVNGNPIPVP
jgi:hypothetical protein